MQTVKDFMSSVVPDHSYGQALLGNVQNGNYPESEEVISAELPPAALVSILELLKQARSDVKVCAFLWETHKVCAETVATD